MNFNFTEAILQRVKFYNSKHSRYLMNFWFKSTKIYNCEFKNSTLMNTDFGNVICKNTSFDDVDLMNTDFFNAKFIKCTFKNVKFMNVFNIDNLQFIDCIFDSYEVHGEYSERLKKLIEC